MSNTNATAPAVTIRIGKDGTPYYEAKWRHPQQDGPAKQVKRRLGKAWVARTGDGDGWTKRRGRTPEGWLDQRSAHVAAAVAVQEVADEAAEQARKAERAATVTVRDVAAEWLKHLENVDDAKPNTLQNYRLMLRDPGTEHGRGSGKAPGRIMGPFADRPIRDVTPKEVARWLKNLDAGKSWSGEKKPKPLSPRNVNYHRQVLHAIFEYACRADTYALPVNPVTATSRRREPPPARLNFYEPDEVELLARTVESGAWRKPRGRARDGHEGPAKPSPLTRAQQQAQKDEAAARAAEDRRDADFFRVLFYTGLRLAELLTLRVEDVRFASSLDGAVLLVHRNVSAGEETSTKSRQVREIPVPAPGAQALARVLGRDEFTSSNDYVFPNRLGRRLDGSALRRRYKAAAKKAKLRVLRLHDLRHAAGSVMARSLPLVEVRDILGHAKLQTTSRYLHSKVDDRAIRAINAAFAPPLQDEKAKATDG